MPGALTAEPSGAARRACSPPSPPLPLRASILEMRQDHEEQLQRLKVLKDREIDAVTSATSHTRWVRHPGPARSWGRAGARGWADPVRPPPQVPERHHRADGEVLQQPARAVLPRGGLAPHHHPGAGAGAPAARPAAPRYHRVGHRSPPRTQIPLGWRAGAERPVAPQHCRRGWASSGGTWRRRGATSRRSLGRWRRA